MDCALAAMGTAIRATAARSAFFIFIILVGEASGADGRTVTNEAGS
jgi:hypothetical protein